MKKLLILLLLLITVPVFAKENKLYLLEDKKTIKYESGLYDDKVFMKHLDMVPGSKYTDELYIENGTDVPYKLYFKAVKKNQGADAEKLLQSISMKITLDDKLIYYGPANGQGNISLADSIYLGEFVPNKKVKMVVETYLSTEYENPKEDDHSYVEWTFYGQLEDEPPHEVVPITGSNISNIVIIASLVLLVVATLIFATYRNEKEKRAI